LKGWPITSIFVLIVLVGAIPSILNDVYGITYGVNIPEGAADIKQKVHYLPTEVTMTLDDKVQWWNNDNTAHTVTSGSYQGGPDSLFNSGILEPNDFYVFQPTINDIGTLSYYCTLHPWMNGFISILDPEGESVGRIAETGSLEAAQDYVEGANVFVSNANEYVDLEYDNQAAVSFMQAAINFEKAAKEYALLDDNQNAAKYYHEAGTHHHNAAVHLETAQDFTQAVVHHLHAGVQHHFAGVQHQMMGDNKSAGKHFAESIMHKGMAKYGSEYVLPPKHQLRWIADASDLTCKEGLEIVQKSTTKEPSCVKPSSVAKLIQRGWAIES
jgi:plastocyanin